MPSKRGLKVVGSSPALILVGGLVLLPLGLVIGVAFDSGAESLRWALTSDAVRKVLWITFRTAFLVTAATILLAYPYAYAMSRCSKAVRYTLLVIVLIPFWTSVTARSFAWIIILQTNGVLNAGLRVFGIDPVSINGTSLAVTIGMTQILLPFAVMPLYTVLSKIDPTLTTASQGLGAPPLRSFFRVYLPLSMPGIGAGALLVFVLSLGFFITPSLLGSPGDTLIAVLIQAQVSSLSNWANAGALSIILLLLTFFTLALAALIVVLVQTRKRVKNAPAT